MNIIEKQTSLGKSLYEINTSTIKEIAELQRENISTYFNTNREFAKRLPEITSFTDFMGLQKEYNETLWNNARGAVEAQTAIVKEAFSGTRDAVKLAFTAEEAEVTTTPADKTEETSVKAAA